MNPRSQIKHSEYLMVAALPTHASARVCRLAARFSTTFGEGVGYDRAVGGLYNCVLDAANQK